MAVPAALALSASGCGSGAASGGPAGKLQVVAAENFWGSIAAQLGGDRVRVTSVIVNPKTDPHSYEPTASDGITLARSKMAIVNGVGYDRWAPKLISANPDSARVVLNVGDLLGLKADDNPHQWYSPASVRRVVAQIVSDYQRLDPGDAAYFDQQRQRFENQALARYDALRAHIKRRYAGTPVGYSESIFEPLGRDLGLELLTPYSFAKAISEGTEVTAQDKQTVDNQAQGGQIKVWVYNSQNATPDVRRLTAAARRAGIPVVTITETPLPAGASFQAWQTHQLEALRAALGRATGR